MKQKTMVVTGATGFIGRALIPALVAEGHRVRACSRRPDTRLASGAVETCRCDLLAPDTLGPALQGADCAWYLVHSMAEGHDYARLEASSARNFAEAAARAGVRRVVYLGGVMPAGTPSAHLASRARVGELLRAGSVPVVELRASMIIGPGSASWQIVRDLSLRLPAMVMPRWLQSRTRPVALADVVVGLVRAAALPIESSAWFDLPGPEVLTGREILERVAALRGRRIPVLTVPLLTPYLSSLWLKLVTRADFSLSRELVLGMAVDLLPRDERYWGLIEHTSLTQFDDAARQALGQESTPMTLRGLTAAAEEAIVDRLSPRARAARASQ
jgi:uncharacterized protein YbjT (DUF2867 family)